VFWTTGVGLFNYSKETIIEHGTAFVHAFLNTMVSIAFLMKYSDREALQFSMGQQRTNQVEEEPLVIMCVRLFLAFQSAYCIMDNLQLFVQMVIQRERIGFRVALIVHHLLILSCCSGIYLMDPYMLHFYARNSLIESTTVFLHIRNFGKAMGNATLYYVGGLATLFIYPLLRVCIPISSVVAILHNYDIYETFIDNGGVLTVLIFNAFVFAMSLYYSLFVLWKKPNNIYILKSSKVPSASSNCCVYKVE